MSDLKSKLKIFVVDDHAVFREGVVRIINQEKDFTVCGEAADATDAMKQIPALKPDLVIVDISLEGISGLDLTKSIRARFPQMRILVLSMFKESLYAERSLRSGANGYIVKRENGRKLISAIRHVLSGQTYVSDEMNELILQKMASGGHDMGVSTVESLSDREFEIFRLIGRGYGTRPMAEELGVSMKTIETHREHIREKLGIKSTFELVQYAINWVHQEESSLTTAK